MVTRHRVARRIPRRVVRIAGRLLSAAVIGVATLLLGKPERDDHWSTPPTAVTVVVDREAQPGGRSGED